MIKVLLVEDDNSFGYVLSEYMSIKNYSVEWVQTVSEAIKILDKVHFDLVVLDINLKNESGYDIANIINEDYPKTPFIFLTARDLKIDQLKGYRLGAQEFITKPIDEEILLAKIEAIISRQNPESMSNKSIFTWKTISLDTHKRALKVLDKTISLTERETMLMKALIQEPESLVPRKLILKNLWDSQDEFSRNSMDVYISRLRKYLAPSKLSIRNVHGKGFILE